MYRGEKKQKKRLSSFKEFIILIILYSFCSVLYWFVFRERERSRSLYAIARPSVCRLSVTFVRPTQAVQIFGNISTALPTLATV